MHKGFIRHEVAESGEAMTIAFESSVRFTAVEGGEVEIPEGEYRAEVVRDDALRLSSTGTGREWTFPATLAWHELPLSAPLALTIPEGDPQRIVVLLPGGAAVSAVGAVGGRPIGAEPGAMSLPSIAEHVVAKAMSLFGPSPVPRSLLTRPETRALWGTIEPGPSPSPFSSPTGVPPNWVRATVASSYGGPGQPGQPTPPGSPVRRGRFPGYLVSVVPVIVDWPLSMVGRVVQLDVTSHVLSVGLPTVLFTTWMDEYQIVPQAPGAVTFPDVIVASGRVPTTPPAPGTSWAAEVAKRFTSASGQGAPTGFELRVDGITVATRDCQYKGRFPGNPALSCA